MHPDRACFFVRIFVFVLTAVVAPLAMAENPSQHKYEPKGKGRAAMQPLETIFEISATYGSGGYGTTTSIAVADINGDGTLDLLAASPCLQQDCAVGSVAVLLGNGDGTFQDGVSYSSGGYAAESVAIGDVNADGHPDAVVANLCPVTGNLCTDGGIVGVLLGNGDGTLQPVQVRSSGGHGAFSIAVADVNGDNKIDLLVANECLTLNCANGLAGGVSVLLGNGDGTFQAGQIYDSRGYQASSIATGDADGDGKPDLLIANLCVSDNCVDPMGDIAVLRNNGDGTFPSGLAYGSGGSFASSITTGDLNEDGNLDVVVYNNCLGTSGPCSGASGAMSVLLGFGNGTFQEGQIKEIPSSTSGQIALADFDGDGKLDIAYGSAATLLLGNGDGTFQDRTDLEVGYPLQARGTAVGDFNSDNKPDLAVGETEGVTILLNIVSHGTTTSLLSAPNPSSFNQPVTFTATVIPQGSGTPTGTVTFADASVTLGTVSLSNGSSTLNISALSPGTHAITAMYNGDPSFSSSSSAPLAQTVNPANTATALTSSANPSYMNQAVTFTASVVPQYGGAVEGSITFKQGASPLATVALANGQASYTTTYTTGGIRSITAIYSGDTNNLGSTSAVLKQTVKSLPAITTTQVTSSGTPSFINQTVVFTATIASTYGPIPDGETVTFRDGATIIGTNTTIGGTATLATSSLRPKIHTIKATYEGDGVFKASSGSVKQTVTLYPTTTALTSSPNPSSAGQAVSFAATVTTTASTPATGMVVFKDGTKSIGTAIIDSGGLATLTKSNLAVGTHSITANYKGDSLSGKSVSVVLVQSVN